MVDIADGPQAHDNGGRPFYDPTRSARGWVRAATRIANLCSVGIRNQEPADGAASVRQICVVRFDHVGDVLSTAPLIHALRDEYAGAEIRMVVGPWARDAAVLVGADVVDSAWMPFYDRSMKGRNGVAAFARSASLAVRLGAELRRSGPDLTIDPRGDPIAGLVGLYAGAPQRRGFAVPGHRLLYTNSAPYPRGWHVSDTALSLVSPPRVRFVPRVLDAAALDAPIGLKKAARFAVHVSGGDALRHWGAERDMELCRSLASHGPVVLVGTGTAEEVSAARIAAAVPGVSDLVGKTSLSSLRTLLKGCDVFIGPDSGPGHLAAHAGIPTVTVFGLRGNPLQFAPRNPRGIVLVAGRGVELAPAAYWARMTVASVLAAVELVLTSERQPPPCFES